MRHTTIILAAAIALSLHTASVGAAEIALPHPWPMHHLVADGTLTVAVTAKSPPKSFSRVDGTLTGMRVDLFRKIAQDLGLKIRFVRLDWPGILPGLFANRFDMACEGVGWTPDRLAAGGFLLTRPLSMSHLVGMVRAQDGITNFAGLAGKRVGGVRGETEYASGLAAIHDPVPVALPGRQEGLMALLNHQIDGFTVDLATAKSLLSQMPDPSRVRIIDPGLPATPESVCINEHEPDLLEAVDILLTHYRVDGTLAAINAAYGGSDDIAGLSAIGY